jgi:hypothetical protein
MNRLEIKIQRFTLLQIQCLTLLLDPPTPDKYLNGGNVDDSC